MPKLCFTRVEVSRALLVAHDDDGNAAQPAETALDRLVVGEGAVAGQRHEIVHQRADVVKEVRALRMARDLGLLPGA